MPHSKGIYLIDTDVLAHIRYRSDSQRIYSGLIGVGHSGALKTVKQVFDELKKHKIAHGILYPHRKHLILEADLQYCAEVSERLEAIKTHAGFLWAQTGGKNPDPADPWLIAVAAVHGFTLVTNEKRESAKKIPAVCKHTSIGVKCITGAEYLLLTGIVSEVKPEHISPHAFFNMPTA